MRWPRFRCRCRCRWTLDEGGRLSSDRLLAALRRARDPPVAGQGANAAMGSHGLPAAAKRFGALKERRGPRSARPRPGGLCSVKRRGARHGSVLFASANALRRTSLTVARFASSGVRSVM